MKILTRSLFAVATVAITATTAAAQAKAPNFTGQWELNAAKSDLGPMAGQLTKLTFTVDQTPTTLKYTQAIGTPQGDRTMASEFTLDGKEITEQNPMGTVVRSAKVDGEAIVIVGKLQGQDGGQTSRWTLSPDGKTMTINQDIASPMGAVTLKLLFDKK